MKVPDALLVKFNVLDLAVLNPTVYLLVDGDDVIYVGATTRGVEQRLHEHAVRFEFDRVMWLAVPRNRRSAYEGALIRFFRPPHNIHTPMYSGGDNAILASLGLDPHDDEDANSESWLEEVRRRRPNDSRRGPRAPELLEFLRRCRARKKAEAL